MFVIKKRIRQEVYHTHPDFYKGLGTAYNKAYYEKHFWDKEKNPDLSIAYDKYYNNSPYEKYLHELGEAERAYNLWVATEYPQLLKQNNVQPDAHTLELEYVNVYAWANDGSLLFFPLARTYRHFKAIPINNSDYYVLTTIPLSEIKYFAQEGDIHYTTKISGGSGGGSDLGGAIIGGALFGTAGAVVASRKETEAIQSSSQRHDERKTILNFNVKQPYFDNNDTYKFDGFDAYNTLNDIIPEKEYNVVQELKKAEILKASQAEPTPTSIPQQIKELAELHGAGILTDEEFTSKKAELLAKM